MLASDLCRCDSTVVSSVSQTIAIARLAGTNGLAGLVGVV